MFITHCWDVRYPLTMSNPNPSRRQFLAGLYASAGAGAVLGACSQTSATAQDSLPDGVIRLSQFSDYTLAFALWARTGGTLVVDHDEQLKRPLTVTLRKGVAYRLTSDTRRSLRYVGPRFHWAICLLAEGENDLKIDGSITVDGGNRVSIALFARFENVLGGARRDVAVTGLTCRNARMVAGRSPVDGSATNAYGSNGMLFMGGFDHLILRGVSVENITRDAGAGLRGSQGCAGIAVVALMGTAASARHVTIEDFTVRHVDSDDASNSKARGDMDGIIVFQSPEAGASAPQIHDGLIVNAAGRAVKIFAPVGGGRTERLRIERDVPGPLEGAVDIAHQHGDGTIADIHIVYSGAAHVNPTTVVGMSSNEPRPGGFPIGRGVISGIRIHDTTQADKKAIVGIHQYNPADSERRRFTIADIRDDGTSEFFFLPGSLGQYGPAEVAIANVSARLRTALFASEDRNPFLDVAVRDSTFTDGRNLPAKVMYDKRPVPPQLRVAVRRTGRIIGLAQ